MILYGDRTAAYKRNNMQANVFLIVLNTLVIGVDLFLSLY